VSGMLKQRIHPYRPPRRCSGGRCPFDVGVAAKATTRPRSRRPRLSRSRCGTRPVLGLGVCRAPGSKSDEPYRPRWRWKSGGGTRGPSEDQYKGSSAHWQSSRRPAGRRSMAFAQASRTILGKRTLPGGTFSVVSIERSRPSEENVVTVPVGCLEYSEPAQGELGRRTETRLGLGGRLASPIPDRPMSVGAALGRRWTDRHSQTRTSNPNTRFDGSTQTRLHAVAASCGDRTVARGAG
jgi:hypothetical protein